MSKFRFIAIDSEGKERKGIVEGASRQQAVKQIRSYGLTPARVTVVKPAGANDTSATATGQKSAKAAKKPMYIGSAVKKKALAEFTRKLATLLQAGLTLVRSLEVLKDQEKNVVFRWIQNSLIESIQSGSTFSDALAGFPKEFDFLYVNMARAGEASGMLEVSLARLATYLEKTERMKARLASAMTYPTVVMVISFVIVMFLLIFVVPKFEQIFIEEIGEDKMPLLTVYVLMVSKFIVGYWYAIFGGLFGLYLFKRLFGATSVGRSLYDWLKLKSIGIGELYTKVYVIRFSRTLGTLIESSVPILDALRITRDACGNKHVISAVETVRNRVKDGEGIASTLVGTKIFPTMVTSMVEVGEETGDLPEMLGQIADIYDEEVDNSISSLTAMVQPLMIVFLAIAVVLIVLALFLPFLSIMQSFNG
ncbi:type II secretion system F family protein [Pelagicoccus sp. NFK12]|uniref:General secretion pathway protein F n=1 Tax=Pelagicoccus enzymogenes TaxID=2773457 RepID=A0A927FBD1_9BACT|nr:type II secretion system F family protein [Pelagicoccus enzymogenes]MBD5780605.1 type II secretion system F family protein [Pelagicoccus enzymogenes]MDQ8198994.1 type II secretion system F family protein [Pelagicoccus enzymogenes]